MKSPISLILSLLLALVVCAALAGYLRGVERRIREAGRAVGAPAIVATPAPVQITRLLRTLKLVAVEIGTVVEATSTDESWRGDVAATISAPARLCFGVDLADERTSLRINPLMPLTSPAARAYILTTPEPRLIAAEVLGPSTSGVAVGWARLRDRAGEFHLGLARERLHEAARAAALRPDDRARVLQATREQLVALVRLFAGESASIEIEFLPAPSTEFEQAGVSTP